jgi:hypothetical protein
MDLQTIRTALLITLSIAVVVLLWRAFRRSVMQRDLPAVQHAELINVEVVYHPARLHVLVSVPGAQDIHVALLDGQHRAVHHWALVRLDQGSHELEYGLPALEDGLFYLEVSTATQRTERQFRLQQA